jgi:putative phage-type endonuclease
MGEQMMDGTFHADRLTGIGGSDLAAILGLSKWRSPYQVWLEKTGRSQPNESSLPMRWGTYAEEFVAREYADRTGRGVQRYNAMLRHPEAPLIGHIDRLVIPEGAKTAAHKGQIRTSIGLECKTVSAFAAGRDSEWGPEGTDQTPGQYLVQCAAYLALTGCQHWDLAALIGNHDFRIYHFHRDHDLEGYLLEESSRWWRDHVIADVPPDPVSEAEARERWPRHADGKVIHATLDLRQRLRQLAVIRRSMRILEADEKAVKDEIYPALADAELVIDNGEEVATYRANKDSQKIDYQALTVDLLTGMDPAEQARLMAEHTRIIPGARVLRLAKNLETTQ